MKKISLRLGLVLVLMAAFLFFFFRSVDWKELLSNLADIDFKFLILAAVFFPSHFLLRGIRWGYLLKHEKKNVGLYNRFAANAVGFTVSFIFPGRLGEIVKPLYLAQKENIRKGFCIGTVVIERAFDVCVTCLLLGIFLVSKPLYATIFHIDEEMYSRLNMWGIIGIVFSVVILGVALSLYFFREKTLRIIFFLLKPLPQKVSRKIKDLADEFIQGLKFFHSVGNLLMYIMWSFLVWLAIITLYWIFLFSFRVQVPFFFLIPYVFLLLVGASIPTPGMVGGFHYFSKIGLTAFYGISASKAVGMTLVFHAIQLVMTYLIGYAILWKEGISLLQLKKLGEDTEP